MKLLRVIGKNFKLLLRAKASAFTVLLGPLLIIILIGLAFSTKATYELSLGYHTPNHNNLTDSFIESLRQSNYYVQEFKDEDSCVKKIEQGIIHTCIIFPENFQITNDNNSRNNSELRFLVDYSRMNLVYKVIESVSGILEIESKELSYSLTQILLSKINITVQDLGKDTVAADDITSRLNLVLSHLQQAKANADAMKFEIGQVSVEDLRSSTTAINETIALMQDKGMHLINESSEWIDDLEDYGKNVTKIRADFEDLKKQNNRPLQCHSQQD